MTDHPTEIEQKLIEFATKTAETIQSQAGQVQAISHVLMVALVSLCEQQPAFKRDFLERIGQVRGQLSERPLDRCTREYFDELVRFLENPQQYAQDHVADDRPKWFKGIISGGKPPAGGETDPPQGQ